MSSIVPHNFEGLSVRTVQIEDKTYFVGKDAAEALGYADATTALRSHCKGAQHLHPLQTSGGMQNMRIIDEPDLMRLVVNSTLPSAERFERWVFEDVLPSIRKTGSYSMAPRSPGEILMLQAQAFYQLEQAQAKITADMQRLETQIEDLAESRVWDRCPQNCEPISKIRARMNDRYGLPQWVVDTVVWKLPLSPKPHGMVRNQHEEAKSSQYEVYAVADITRVFAQFVDECVQETAMRASHRHIDRMFQLLRDGKKLRALKAHAEDAQPA
ncbi:prophage antirepressor-like protein [Delftia sp. 60]|uniref:BRO-N domain-containing protein n=1 Tax=Delftia sp. 60 TaxID=2035216 RepID=UPI000C1A6C9D|nr:BRO family protein [Delftia sp. 60]PIF38033.1 prophage antirepressor-like protein [Burkholderiales bacterium 23]PIF66786.1 prophage antirepressor-like protein [Delftia sp. 60]